MIAVVATGSVQCMYAYTGDHCLCEVHVWLQWLPLLVYSACMIALVATVRVLCMYDCSGGHC